MLECTDERERDFKCLSCIKFKRNKLHFVIWFNVFRLSTLRARARLCVCVRARSRERGRVCMHACVYLCAYVCVRARARACVCVFITKIRSSGKQNA